jgi:hypothetical protein
MNHIDTLKTLIRDAARRHDTWQVFRDFLGMTAIAFSNAVDPAQCEAREDEYLAIVSRYDRADIDLFPQMLAALTRALEEDPSDVLGRVFAALVLGNKWTGQFFTPDNVCRMMAAMSFDEQPARDHCGARIPPGHRARRRRRRDGLWWRN